MSPWIQAIRPKTLPASASPVLIGGALAFYYSSFEVFSFLGALVCALILQIIANFYNEVGDYKRGADSINRLGPDRAVSQGVISPKAMKNASLLLSALSIIIGVFLVMKAGIPILIIGVLSILFAFLYTAGPFPISYLGLGDIAAFVFFGLVAVSGTFYIQTLAINWFVLFSSIAPGLLIANILGVNNYRDADNDKLVSKKTLPVRFGKHTALKLYYLLVFATYLITIVIALSFSNYWILIALFSAPLAFSLCQKMKALEGKALNAVLAGSGKLVFIFSALYSIGLILSKIL